jgi:hypothetical protein
MFLCLTEQTVGPAVVQDVRPHATIGTGFRLAGLGIHDFVHSETDTPIIGVLGFPPTFPRPLADPLGFVVDQRCPAGQPGSRVIELIVGLQATSDDGGGWLGVDVHYSIGQASYILEIRNEMLICGAAVADMCAPAASAPALLRDVAMFVGFAAARYEHPDLEHSMPTTWASSVAGVPLRATYYGGT